MAAVVVQHQLVISGGSLKRGDAWVPDELNIIHGQPFLPIQKSSLRLQRFCGVSSYVLAPFANNMYFDIIRGQRNAAVDHRWY